MNKLSDVSIWSRTMCTDVALIGMRSPPPPPLPSPTTTPASASQDLHNSAAGYLGMRTPRPPSQSLSQSPWTLII